MNILFWALTIGTIGKVLLGIGVLFVHHKMAQERIIDLKVLKSFRLEFILTAIGIMLIVAGYGLELYFYNMVSMLTCSGTECALSATAILGR
jgi:hypothetical protein